MRNKNQKGKCVKLTLPHFDGVIKTYDDLQLAAAKLLSANSDFVSIQSNVDCVEVDGTKYTTDFVCQSKISVTFQRNSKRRENYYAIPLKEDDDEDAARVYEENCLKTMKASLSIDAEVNRKICETCTDERCAYKRKDA